MEAIVSTQIRNWTSYQKFSYPQSVDSKCPHCKRTVNFSLVSPRQEPFGRTITAEATCPGCSQKVVFIGVQPTQHVTVSTNHNCDGGVYMFPAPSTARKPVFEDGDLGSPGLERACKETLEAYNTGLYAACASTCRRALEGIIKLKDPEGKGTLAQRLEAILEKPELLEPLHKSTRLIREGGNVGAHFDLEREPTDAIAQGMIELLDFLIEYLFLMEKRYSHLEYLLSDEYVKDIKELL